MGPYLHLCELMWGEHFSEEQAGWKAGTDTPGLLSKEEVLVFTPQAVPELCMIRLLSLYQSDP